MAWPRETAAGAKPWGQEAFPKKVEMRALVFYRAILGGQGASRKREDGTVVRRGLSEKMWEQLTIASERRVRAEVLIRRVAHFNRGVMIGSREFVGWVVRGEPIRRKRQESAGAQTGLAQPWATGPSRAVFLA